MVCQSQVPPHVHMAQSSAKDRQFVEVLSGVGEVSRAFRDVARLESEIFD